MKYNPPFLTCCLFIALVAAAQEKPAEPSLAETTDWIRNTLASHGKCVQTKGDTTDSTKIENLRFDNCTLSGTLVLESAFNSRVIVSAIADATVRLSDVNQILVKSQDEHWLIVLHTKGKQDIKSEVRIGLPGQLTRSSVAVDEFNIPCDDEAIADRIRKALMHAVDLCKKQKEPF